MVSRLGELLKWGKATLKSAGISDNEISATLLLQSILNKSRHQILLDQNLSINQNNIEKYKDLIQKRSRHVPLQHLIGEVEFYNIKLKCDNRALIPRPETEILVETIIEKLRNEKSPSILDIGTGSGNIAIALAYNLSNARITAIDISQDALDLAISNAQLNGVEDKVTFANIDIFNSDSRNNISQFDCVVSNPPYVDSADKSSLQPEVRDFEPDVALYSPGDPLRFFKDIISNITMILKPGGLLAFETGKGQAESIRELMKPVFRDISIVKDLAGIDRVVYGIYGLL